MNARRKRHLEYRKKPNGYYHLCTDGRPGVLLFHNDEEFARGMTAMALVSIKFKVQIYVFELMPNHIHIVLSSTGSTCVDIFVYLVRKISRQLVDDGFPSLPADYDFRLIDIDDIESFRHHYLYSVRNPYEKGWCSPGSYPWGSDYLLFSGWGNLVKGERVGEISQRKLREITRSKVEIPSHWEIHPDQGILPKNYIAIDKVKQLFPDVKQYMTQCIKDYESYVHVADSLGESINYTLEETGDLLQHLLREQYNHRSLYDLSAEEKCRLAVLMNEKYRVDPTMIAQKLRLPIRIVNQTLRSKDYGSRKRKQ